jgi:hypothetical protein
MKWHHQWIGVIGLEGDAMVLINEIDFFGYKNFEDIFKNLHFMINLRF